MEKDYGIYYYLSFFKKIEKQRNEEALLNSN